jgi:hypothetical protein
LLQVAANRYGHPFLTLALYLHILSPYHRAESYTLNILLTCRVIQLLHSLVIPLLHQCPACSHLKSQTSGWLISLGYASTGVVSIPMLKITLSSNKTVIICKSCSQITWVSCVYLPTSVHNSFATEEETWLTSRLVSYRRKPHRTVGFCF